MVRQLVGAVGLAALACAVLTAADFWDAKPFAMWSDKELQRITTDSPWARKVSVAPPGRGGGGGARGGGGRRGGGGDDNQGGGGGRGGAPDLQLIITWRSVLPMKQALVRGQIGLGGAMTPAGQELLDRKETGYVVSVYGLPGRLAGGTTNLGADTYLKVGDKAPLAPEEALAQPSGNDLILGFVFPRTAIELADKEVEFVTKVGAIEIRKKFNLKDMMFHGQLEL